ncbi:MAG: SRPBCC family protein [Ferruginibacter sp.]
MRILKIILYTILTIIVIGLVAGLFISKEYKVEKEVTISKPRQEVFEFLKYLKNQDKFSYWATLDSGMQKHYSGTDGTVGFISGWKGNKDVGQGEQEIAGIKEGERIDYKLRFKEPMESNMDAYITTEDAGPTATKVKWAIYGTSKYPWNIMNPFMDNMMGGDISFGLNKLKTILEK